MWIADGILAGLIAGALMGFISQLGYWMGVLKSHLIVIDGEFALRTLNQNPVRPAAYAAGIIIHLITSIIFGLVYAFIARLANVEPQTAWLIAIYVFLLWLAMLLVALPAAGQGVFGRRVSRLAWLEQLVLHIVFGFSLWWALGIV